MLEFFLWFAKTSTPKNQIDVSLIYLFKRYLGGLAPLSFFETFFFLFLLIWQFFEAW